MALQINARLILFFLRQNDKISLNSHDSHYPLTVLVKMKVLIDYSTEIRNV